MEAALQELATIAYEIGRAIRSPYTPSLQPLYEVLSRSSSNSIKAWLDTNKCCIDAFAEVVLDSLCVCPGSVNILVILCKHQAFQQACWSHSPALLASSLDAALSPNEFQQQHHELCMILLSNECFGSGPLPANILPFLNRFVKHFTTEPSNAALSQILALLRSESMHSWPPDCLEGIQATTVRVLREGHDDEGTSLLCLAVLSALASSPQANDECRAQCHDFFAERKANKTLVLGITSSIKSLSAYLDGKRFVDESVDHLRLAGMIFDALENKTLLVLDRTICLFTRKLCEKIQKAEVSPLVRAAGTMAVSKLLGDKLPQNMVDQLQSLVLDANYFQSCAFPAEMMERFLTRFGDSFASNTVQLCLDISRHSDKSDGWSLAAHHIAWLIKPLFHVLPQSPRIRDAVRKAFAQPSVQNQFSDFIQLMRAPESSSQTPSLPAQFSKDGCCVSEIKRQRDAIALNLCQLFVLSCPDLDMRLSALAMKQIAQCNTHADCEASKYRKGLLSSSAGSAGTEDQDLVVDSYHWRDNLKALMQANTDAQTAKLDQYFQAACFDLEKRCNEIERPLREKELVIAEQESTIEDLRTTITRLRSDAQASADQHEQTAMAKISLEHQLRDLGAEAEQALDASKHERDAAVVQIQQQATVHKERECELLAKISSSHAELEQQVRRSEVLQCEVQEAQKHLTASRAACDSLSEKITVMEEEAIEAKQLQLRLQDECTELQQALTVANTAKNETFDALQSKDTENKALAAQIVKLKGDLGTLADEKLLLQQELHDSKEEAARLQEDMANRNEKLLYTKDQELSDQSIFYDQALDQIRQELQSVHESALSAAQHHEEIIRNLKHELKTLRQDKEKRAKELAQAQQLGHQLMGLMQQPIEHASKTAPNSASDGTVTDNLSSMLHETQVSQVPDSFTSLKTSPNKRRAAGRRALSELPQQSPVKSGSHERRVSWAPQYKRRGSVFQSSSQDENMLEQSLDE